MNEVIKFLNAARQTMSTCAAIRATTVRFVDVPRGDLCEVLVKGAKLNHWTVRTQVQLGREQANLG